MTDDGAITNQMLLEHMQASILSSKVEVLQRIDKLEGRVDRLQERVEKGFEEARQHRQALQEDLDATIRTQFKHQKQLALLSGEGRQQQ